MSINYVTSSEALTATADAIRRKTGSSDAIEYQEGTGFAGAIDAIPTGGGGDPVIEKDVNFYDYDGTLVYSYGADEFLSLSAMPDVPVHEEYQPGYWNWSFEGAKNAVAKAGFLDIGNKVKPYAKEYEGKGVFTVYFINPNNTSVSLTVTVYTGGSCIVDYGDGTTEEITTINSDTTVSHTYSEVGTYNITLTKVGAGQLYVKKISDGGTSSACTSLTKIYTNGIGFFDSGDSSLEEAEFYNSKQYDGTIALRSCPRLKKIIISNCTLYSGDTNGAFYGCAMLDTFICDIERTGRSMFTYNKQLKMLIFDNELIDQNTFTNAPPINVINGERTTFLYNYNYSESGIRNAYIKEPTGYILYKCSMLKRAYISNTTQILAGCFRETPCLKYVKIPKEITTIGAYAFHSTYGSTIYDFSEHEQVPTLVNTNAFSTNPQAVIKVPNSLLETWKSETNWATWADNIVGV